MDIANLDGFNPLKNPDEYQDLVLETMKKYEVLIGELYAIYAEKIPDHKEFWTSISKEEGTHAYWLETLSSNLSNKQVFFNEDRFNLAPLAQCIIDVTNRIKQAKESDVSIMEALAISNDIEQGMIERKFFEVYESDSVEINRTLLMLKEATILHEKKVMQELEKIKMEKPVEEKKRFFSWFR
jgi:rubrerythrin